MGITTAACACVARCLERSSAHGSSSLST
jgi:hypothetical protein